MSSIACPVLFLFCVLFPNKDKLKEIHIRLHLKLDNISSLNSKTTTISRWDGKGVMGRYRHWFFYWVGHETIYASSGNKHFFTKWCHRQTYQNYEQSRQKLGTFLENKILQKSFQKKTWKDSINFPHWKMTENQNFEMFEEVVHNFGKSDDDMI